MNQTEYLYTHYQAPLPAWLWEINKNSRIPWKEFFGSRTVFYPGSGIDPYTVNAFTRSHSAYCFVNVDYGIAKEKLENNLKKPMFPGYDIIYERDISESFFFSMFRQPYSFVADVGLDSGKEVFHAFTYSHTEREDFDTIKHYVKFLVFELKAGLDNSFGAARFALLFIGGDAFPVFNALYANKNANLFAMLIDDYGYGGQYARYGKDQLLHKIALRRNVFPELILTERCTGERMWDGFYEVDVPWSPSDAKLGRVSRTIYKKEE